MTKSTFKEKDAIELRTNLQAAIQVALQETMKTPLHVKFNASSITHTALEPEGDSFMFMVSVAVHPKKEEAKDVTADIPAKSQ